MVEDYRIRITPLPRKLGFSPWLENTMNEQRLGELPEQEFMGMMDFVLSEEFDQMPAAESFGALKAMDKAKAPERVLVKGHIEDNRFIPHAVEGAKLEGKQIRVKKEAVIEILLEAA